MGETFLENREGLRCYDEIILDGVAKKVIIQQCIAVAELGFYWAISTKLQDGGNRSISYILE